MRGITYLLLIVYAIPIFVIAFAGFATDGFSIKGATPLVAHAISGSFFSLFRDTFGSIIVPLVTAYSIDKRQVGEEISRHTIGLLVGLIGFFVLVTLLYGYVKFHEEDIATFNTEKIPDIATLFQDVILTYAKESLAYIALALGISLKK